MGSCSNCFKTYVFSFLGNSGKVIFQNCIPHSSKSLHKYTCEDIHAYDNGCLHRGCVHVFIHGYLYNHANFVDIAMDTGVDGHVRTPMHTSVEIPMDPCMDIHTWAYVSIRNRAFPILSDHIYVGRRSISAHLSVHLSVRPLVRPSVSDRPSVRPTVRPPDRPSDRPFGNIH